jgi:hypothetical protein
VLQQQPLQGGGVRPQVPYRSVGRYGSLDHFP